MSAAPLSASAREPLRVMHVITRLDRGGSAQNTLETAIGLADRCRTLLVHGLSLESEMTEAEAAAVAERIAAAGRAGVRMHPLPSLARRIDPPRDFMAFLSLWRLIRRERPHIFHTHTSKAGMLGRWAAFLAGAPHIVHTPHGHVFHGYFGKWASRIFFLLERLAMPVTERLVALTGGERRDYLRWRLCRDKKIRVIHSGVDVGPFMASGSRMAAHPDERRRMRAALGLPPDSPVVGMVGWLSHVKDPLTLLRAMDKAWKRHPAALLLYVGKGDMAGRILAEARALGAADRVRLAGWRPDMERIMPIFDIFVLPSRNEGMGRVLVEAMAAGRPVIGSRTGGIPDLIDHGVNGFLTPPGDAEALGAAICRLLDDPALARRMGEMGRKRCMDYDLDAMIKKLERLYEHLHYGI